MLGFGTIGEYALGQITGFQDWLDSDEDTETWTQRTAQSETWTERTKQSETWTDL